MAKDMTKGSIAWNLAMFIIIYSVTRYGNRVIVYAEAIAWTFMLVLYVIRFFTKHFRKENRRIL